jgi:alpha-glucosidase
MRIDSIFGTQDDLTELLNKAKEQELKVIFDFIPNHSSDQHSWFQQSVRRENGYDDFYIWRSCNRIINDVRQPVNNWVIFDLHTHTHTNNGFVISALLFTD